MMKDNDKEKLLHESLESHAADVIPADANLWPRITSQLIQQRRSFGARLIPTTAGAWICAGLVLLLVITTAGFGGAVAAGRLFTSSADAEQLQLQADSTIELGKSQILNGITITLERAYILGNLIGIEYTVRDMPKPYRDEEGRYHQFEPGQETLRSETGAAILEFTRATASKAKSGNIDTRLPVFDSSTVRDYGPELHLSFSLLIKETLSQPDSTEQGNQVEKRVEPVAGPFIFKFSVTLPEGENGAASVNIFVDPQLEEAVREAINKPDGQLYPEDLEGLEYLNYTRRIYNTGANSTNLTGLEYCINLTELHLNHNQIADISPLSGLTSLTELYLNSNYIADISPLSRLTNVTVLDLDSNRISDLSALSGLTRLKNLSIASNQINNISALSGLTGLERLSLRNNKEIADISPLFGLINLTYLQLEYNQISDISALAGMTNLLSVYLGNNRIADISPLTNLPHLAYVSLKYNPLSTASVFTYIPQLRESLVTID